MFHAVIKTRISAPILNHVECDINSSDIAQAEKDANEFLESLQDLGYLDDDAYVDSVYEMGS